MDNEIEHSRACPGNRRVRRLLVRDMPLLIGLLSVLLLPSVTWEQGTLHATSTGDIATSMGYISVKDYGAKGNGRTDDTRAIQAASRHAAATHGTVLIPAGTYLVSSPILFDGCNILGAGVGTSVIRVNKPLVSGSSGPKTFLPKTFLWKDFGHSTRTTVAGTPAAIVLDNTTNGNVMQTVSDFSVVGPGLRKLGVRTALCDGINITHFSTPHIEHVDVRQFDAGFVWSNLVGHIYMYACHATDNYYGIYCENNGNDYFITDSVIGGNTFASLATTASAGFAGMTISNTHLGFGPFGIYQERTPANQGRRVFLADVVLTHVRFEQIGNEAIYSAAQFDDDNKNVYQDVVIEHPGYSSSQPRYTLSDQPRKYAVDLPLVLGYNQILSGMGSFYTPNRAGQFSAQTPEEAAKDTRPPGLNTFHFRQIGDTANAYFCVIDPTVTRSMFTIDLGAPSHVLVGPHP